MRKVDNEFDDETCQIRKKNEQNQPLSSSLSLSRLVHGAHSENWILLCQETSHYLMCVFLNSSFNIYKCIKINITTQIVYLSSSWERGAHGRPSEISEQWYNWKFLRHTAPIPWPYATRILFYIDCFSRFLFLLFVSEFDCIFRAEFLRYVQYTQHIVLWLLLLFTQCNA